MWSSNRRTFLLGALAAPALAACGFTPAYGPQGGGAKLLSALQVDAPQSQDDFAYRRRLSERLGPAQTPRYRLSYTITTGVMGQAISQDDVTNRYSLNGTATYRLYDMANDAVLLTGRVSSFTSWSATGTIVATQTAERDAHKRLMRILADQTVTRLLAQAGSLPE
ncbi:LPS assembly lipoprotein LptE [Thioclava sp. GXIMD4216]|uniref:LPS assembly lipoprotein LptE n=1 Tax=Thioclava litoralis TaxID=3076557 RepID=A0ABZ1E1I8_9RHOB|nr:LPS assembly lipoprotein LptE [Thioclava sp. FTW29]